jgi:hypothetical protein
MVFAPNICVLGAVIAATDNNPGTAKLARKIREIAEAAERQDLGIIDHRPDTEGHDWNDVQRALTPQSVEEHMCSSVFCHIFSPRSC